MFKVNLNSGHDVLGYTAGKMRRYRIKIFPGERVKVELSPYDPSPRPHRLPLPVTAKGQCAPAFVFETELVDHPGVTRTIAVRGSHTLVTLHAMLRVAYGWEDDHLYSFWLDGEFWGDRASEYTAPFELEEGGATSAETRLDRLGLEPGQEIAYVFDFGDEWRVRLRLADLQAVGGTLPRIVESRGDAPPQYPDYVE